MSAVRYLTGREQDVMFDVAAGRPPQFPDALPRLIRAGLLVPERGPRDGWTAGRLRTGLHDARAAESAGGR